mmetsp:Transcript_11935/g.31561  ORF Transcript_11935/g.31561 Transcript_11935/m.31561 type:complete len:207 (+) Transcript_11935:854-1474(+)
MAGATLSGWPSISVARWSSSSGSTSADHPGLSPALSPASLWTFISLPASTRPAMSPPTMAEEEEPKPEQMGTLLRVVIFTGGIGTSPAYSKAFLSAVRTRCLDSPFSPTVVVIRVSPSPSLVIENLSDLSTMISFQMSTAMPMASNPGPMLAEVAGTRTATFCLFMTAIFCRLGAGPLESPGLSWPFACSAIARSGVRPRLSGAWS